MLNAAGWMFEQRGCCVRGHTCFRHVGEAGGARVAPWVIDWRVIPLCLTGVNEGIVLGVEVAAGLRAIEAMGSHAQV
jgi:hypothetical protein